VTRLEDAHGASERRACTVAQQHRSTQRYRPKIKSDEERLIKDMHRLVQENPRRGCRHITTLLQQEGWRINYKRVHRLWKLEGFKVPRKRRKKRAIGNASNACDKRKATAKNDVWTWDFIHDRTVDGRQLKHLDILDEYTRECLCLEVERSFKADDVLELLSQVMGKHGVPKHIRSDNGSEFIAKKMKTWLEKVGVETLYIEPGAPWQNGYVESFNSRLRDEFLETNYFYTLAEAKELCRAWKEKYNTKRPQKSLGKISPSDFAALCSAPGSASLRSATPATEQSAMDTYAT
jgi:putative transposase